MGENLPTDLFQIIRQACAVSAETLVTCLGEQIDDPAIDGDRDSEAGQTAAEHSDWLVLNGIGVRRQRL